MIRLEPWNDFAERAIARIEGACMVDIRREVQIGRSQLWHCSHERKHGYVVTRLEERESGREWVLVAGVGKGFHEFVPFFIAAAAARGLPLRAHVNRCGMVRMYERVGFHISEYVVRKP